MLQDELRAQAQEAQEADAVDVAATLRNLADRLSEYCGEGTYAYLLDRETTVPLEAPLVVFDTRRCPESELRLVMFQVMEYVTTTVERHWQAHKAEAGKPGAPLFLGRSIMLIDEAWHLISRPETGAYANNLARRARHLGLVLIVMCQQLSDFDTEHGVALLGNSSQQLLLAQNPKEIPFIADTLQLSEREAAELHGSRRSRAATRRCCGSTAPAATARSRSASARPSTGRSPPTRPRSRSARPRSPATTATCGRRSPRSPSAAPARTATSNPTPRRRA